MDELTRSEKIEIFALEFLDTLLRGCGNKIPTREKWEEMTICAITGAEVFVETCDMQIDRDNDFDQPDFTSFDVPDGVPDDM